MFTHIFVDIPRSTVSSTETEGGEKIWFVLNWKTIVDAKG
jgi:hypothetical protein